jgi:23S rRNA (cytidine1920-2'-O)/16S rRNA (cytidine1409-2'-O)-methyltransferase
MTKKRLDQALVEEGLVATRSQAGGWVRLGKVFVNGQAQTKPGFFVPERAKLELKAEEQYVSRAALKLASVAKALKLNFKDKVMLDVGSSTGGFTDYALQHGARRVIAVDVGTDQLHPSLRTNPQIELHEQTDIRDVWLRQTEPETRSQKPKVLVGAPDIIVIDVSFISLREVLPHISCLMSHGSLLVAMVKPQFEATAASLKHKGVIKNDRMRRDILKSFEDWAKKYFMVAGKADSEISGAKGNLERFYLLRKQNRGKQQEP